MKHEIDKETHWHESEDGIEVVVTAGCFDEDGEEYLRRIVIGIGWDELIEARSRQNPDIQSLLQQLAESEQARAELVLLANTLIGCYDRNPRNFAVARQSLEKELAKYSPTSKEDQPIKA